MSSEMTPCLSPRICGVQNHRPDTNPKCQNPYSRQDQSGSHIADLTQVSSSAGDSSPSVLDNNLSVDELAKELNYRDYVEIKHSTTSAGTQKILTADLDDEDSIYGSTDSPLNGKIVTKDGVEAYAYAQGGQTDTKLKDGSTFRSYVRACDEDGDDLDHKFTREELEALDSIHYEAYDIGFVDNFPSAKSRKEEIKNISGAIIKAQG